MYQSLRSRCLIFLLLSIGLTNLIGCGEDSSPTESLESYPFTVTVGSAATDIDLADLDQQLIDSEPVIILSDLVDTSVITEPYNYAYRIVGSDGFYAHMKGSPDNTWDHLQSGYIILTTMDVTFDPSLNLSKRYNIKNAHELRVLRKIDFITGADSLVQNVLADMPHTAFQDSLTGIPLTEFIPDNLSNPEKYQYELVASDGYSQVITWDQLQKAWYVFEEDRILYTIPDIENKKKVKTIQRIMTVEPEVQ